MKKLLTIFSICLTLSFLFATDQGHAQSTNFGTVSQLCVDIDGDNIKEDVWLYNNNQYSEDGVMATKYFIKVFFEDGKTLLLEDAAETEGSRPAYLMDIKISENVPSMIGIAYSAGAHGGELDIYKYENGEMKKDLEIFSDLPYLEIKDTDNDGIKEIVAYSRDYGGRPLRDTIISTYKYVDGKWNKETHKE